MSKTAFKWNVNQTNFKPFREHEGSIIDVLPVGIYEPHMTMFGIHLERKDDKFVFNHKIYGVNKEFISRCLNTYKETSNNMGILLNGIKGTGKTVTAKILANEFNLPVIIISNVWEGALFSFLADNIRQDVVLLFDEFEKSISKEEQSKMLTFMDGITSGTNRKVFILTTNLLTVNDNLMSRPSRIRYHKSFGNLSVEILEEVATDMLLPDTIKYKSSLIEVLRSFSIITMDNVVQFINELNIHKKDPKVLVVDFNISRNSIVARLTEKGVEDAKSIMYRSDPSNIKEGERLSGIGRVRKINEDNTITMYIGNDLYSYYDTSREIDKRLNDLYLASKTQEEKEESYFSFKEDSTWMSNEEFLTFLTQDLIDKYVLKTFIVTAEYADNSTFVSSYSKYDVGF